MNRSLRNGFFASAFFLAAGPVPGRTGGASELLHVHIDNQAQAPPSTLHWATVEASRLFKAAGIEVIWEQPQAEAPEAQGIEMSTAAGDIHTRPYLVVRLLSDMPA